MKRVILTTAAFSLLFWLAACKQKSAETETNVSKQSHNSQNSLDWAGTYTGTIPAADADGIKVRITLKQDGNYTLVYEYLGKKVDPFESSGTFTWNDTGSIITLGNLDKNATPVYYQVGENTLTQLDLEGNKITGEFADMYILKKES